MKNNLFAILFIAIAFTACTKANNDTYVTSSRSTVVETTTTTNTSSRGNTPGTTTTTPAVSPVAFNNSNQSVKVGLNNKTLTMNFYENINLLARKDSLASAWSITFLQDFTSTQLGKFNYTITGKNGTVTSNFAESNLNNVVISSTKDTIISNITYTKISFNRNFIFTNIYNTSVEAATEYDYLLNNKETIYFSAYLNSATGKSTIAKSSSVLVYSSN